MQLRSLGNKFLGPELPKEETFSHLAKQLDEEPDDETELWLRA